MTGINTVSFMSIENVRKTHGGLYGKNKQHSIVSERAQPLHAIMSILFQIFATFSGNRHFYAIEYMLI